MAALNNDFDLEKHLADLGYGKSRIVKLAGDASTRQYFRLFYSSGTRIIMEQEPFNPEKNPFNLCHSTFSKLGIKIPHIHHMIPERGIMILEDLGDTHLQNIEAYSPEYQRLFTNAVDTLCRMQLNAAKLNPATEYPLSYAFDFKKFYGELHMTTDYYLKGYRKKEITPALESRLNQFYTELVQELLAQPFLLQHRDYHSRNLIVSPKGDELCVIDFQDARMGPYTYDMASMIIDPYANIDDAFSKSLVKMYFEKIGVDSDYNTFMRNYNLSFLQRGVKILGTFAYQHIVRHNDVYLKYIPISIEKLRTVTESFPKWATILGEVME